LRHLGDRDDEVLGLAAVFLGLVGEEEGGRGDVLGGVG